MRGSLVKTFRDAFTGLGYVVRTQRNARIHLAITLLVFVIAAWLRITAQDWAILVLTAALVWTSELINTALEAVVDLASPQEQPLARAAKDLAAGAVLIAALAAIVVGVLLLGPALLRKLMLG
ncbi:MAG: diacylglycerol kinase family protein [Chloroflexota bacterium]